MEARAMARTVRISPRKADRVLRLIRNQSVNRAEEILEFTDRPIAKEIKKILHSAAANARQKFEEDLALVDPQLVVFSIGINDAHDPAFSPERFERNYDELIARVRRAAPDAAVLLVTNSDSYRKRRYPVRNAGDVRDVMMRLATRHGCGVWDLYGVMGGPGSIRRWQRHGLARADLVHFTREGYELIGDLMFTAIMKNFGEHAAGAARGNGR